MEAATKKRTARIGRRRKRPTDLDVSLRLNQILNSIYEASGDNPLNAGQLKVVIEHLKYALVVGWENRA